MIFDNISFISADRRVKNNDNIYDPAFMFRKTFTLEAGFLKAILYVAGLGIGYHYINGKPVSEDLFTPAASEYTKTIWYNRYDVSKIIHKDITPQHLFLEMDFSTRALRRHGILTLLHGEISQDSYTGLMYIIPTAYIH